MQNTENSLPLELSRILLQNVGMDLVIKRAQWVKTRSDYESLLAVLDEVQQDINGWF
jgi:hypothetical protein